MQHHRCEIAVAEARHLDRARGEQRTRSGAVADRAGAHADGVDGHLQEGVEGDDLVHVATAKVHPVGERIRELGGDRADLAPDAAQVVQQPRPLRRQLLEQAGEAEHVHLRPMIAHVTADRETLLFEIVIAGQLVNELAAREFARRRLKVGAQLILTHIQRSGPITPSELERATGLRPSTLRERMQPLFDGELVRRVPSTEDRRSHSFEITDRGQALQESTWPAIQAAERALEAQLGRPLETHAEALRAIVRAAQAALVDSAESALD
jgi:DNA-binding MarR family transcriptional regulator